ncbi:hypothetical protein OKA05_08715 [Luteolibacter arcticus]|uniref:SprT-like domain-containing protein n=1 Tax=Luteolibacter arcticus TaxID=1581411 RepID=A0ABT3GG90_9BACT|nr:hypothetical protein [Luteolibacter arcticus]MCW1922634.1 hypothetical protein [Luteolibacter arcticus]
MPHTRRTPRRPLRHIITLSQLDRANTQVSTEMARHGIWSDELAGVGVFLVPASLTCYGWHDGSIAIPSISGAHLRDLCNGQHTRLTDVLRHEWAHAVADTFSGFVESDLFVRCFDGAYQDTSPVANYDPSRHVTRYAAARPCEDFAEVFHYYLRHRSRLPLRLSSRKPVVKKWEFIHRMARRIAAGKFSF